MALKLSLIPSTKRPESGTGLAVKFVNWDGRPAVLGDTEAKAMLEPASDWVPAPHGDVWSTGALMSEPAWRARFNNFSPLDPLPTLDQVGPAESAASE